MLFIELFVDWAEWVGREATPNELKEMRGATVQETPRGLHEGKGSSQLEAL